MTTITEKSETNSNVKLLTSYQKYLLTLLHQSHLKSNFYMIIISVLLIHFWIISTYLFSYIISSSSYSLMIARSKESQSAVNISTFIEMFLATIGGIGTALFFKNILLGLFEISSCNKLQTVRHFIDFNLNNNSPCENLLNSKKSKSKMYLII